MVEFGNCLVEPISNIENSKPCGIRAARKLRVVRRQERWADKVFCGSEVCDGVEVQEGTQHLFHQGQRARRSYHGQGNCPREGVRV